jgi:selenocysteine-specific translation elongation factor
VLVGDRDLGARIALRLAQARADRLERRDELVAGAEDEVTEVLAIHRPSG